jgi:hypothetical protein
MPTRRMRSIPASDRGPTKAQPGPHHECAGSFKNRDREERHLKEAEEHIARGEQRIAALQALISEAQSRRDDVAHAQATLAIMIEVQQTFTLHRTKLLQTLADIDAGKYAMPDDSRVISLR